MARKDRKGATAGRLRALLEAGDHRTAAAEARALLADAAADDAIRADAAAVLASLAPDRGVFLAGAAGAVVAVALAVWTLLAR
jgi:hypothetical protein